MYKPHQAGTPLRFLLECASILVLIVLRDATALHFHCFTSTIKNESSDDFTVTIVTAHAFHVYFNTSEGMFGKLEMTDLTIHHFLNYLLEQMQTTYLHHLGQ